MTIKLEVGKVYELNDGSVRECTAYEEETEYRSEEYGPYTIMNCWYHEDGKFGDRKTPSLDVKRCMTPELDEQEEEEQEDEEELIQPFLSPDAMDTQPTTDPEQAEVSIDMNTPTIWLDTTEAEKGALLLASHRGEVIERFYPSDNAGFFVGWAEEVQPTWSTYIAYRVKPAPKITECVLWWMAYYDAVALTAPWDDHTHKITIRYPGEALPFGTYTGPDGAEFVVGDAK